MKTKHKKIISESNKTLDSDWNAEHDLNLLEHDSRFQALQSLTAFSSFLIDSKTVSVPLGEGPATFLIISKATVNSNASSGEWRLTSLLKVDGVEADMASMTGSGPDQMMTSNNLHILTVNAGESKTIDLSISTTVDANLYPASAMFVIIQIGNAALTPIQE